MRTLKTIYEDICKGREDYKARQEAQAARIAELQAAMESDAAAKETATQTGDSAAYTRATTDQAFHAAQLENVRRSKLEPICRLDEANAIKRETYDRAQADFLDVYERMRKNRQEAFALYAEVEAILAEINKITSAMSYDVMKGEKAFQMLIQYPVHSLDLFKRGSDDMVFERGVRIVP